MNLCFKNLGISGSGIMNNETLREAQQNTRKSSCVRSRECRIWRFRESNFPKILYKIFIYFPEKYMVKDNTSFFGGKLEIRFWFCKDPRNLLLGRGY